MDILVDTLEGEALVDIENAWDDEVDDAEIVAAEGSTTDIQTLPESTLTMMILTTGYFQSQLIPCVVLVVEVKLGLSFALLGCKQLQKKGRLLRKDL